jgi:hypothetical protein
MPFKMIRMPPKLIRVPRKVIRVPHFDWIGIDRRNGQPSPKYTGRYGYRHNLRRVHIFPP